MKRLLLFTAIFLLIVNINNEAKTKYLSNNGISFNYFYSALQPHGEWIEIDYDVYVWRPYRVSHNWQPYSAGRWAWTNYGWYWDSYEPFGWATYHYGRWYFDDYFGWVWMPGYYWAPSWVEWRYSDDYIGWAPLSPYAAFDVRRGIHFSISWRTSYNHWHFVSFKHFGSHNIYHHYVDNSFKNRIFEKTKYRTNYYADNGRIVNGGIDRNFVERKSGTRIQKRDITQTSRVNDYSNSRNSNSDKIIAYRPSTSEIQKYRDIKRDDITVNRGRSTIKRDKIAIDSRSNNSANINRDIKRDVQSEKKINRTSEIKQKSSEPIRKQEQRVKPKIENSNKSGAYKRGTEVKREVKKNAVSESKKEVPVKRRSVSKNVNEKPKISTGSREKKETVKKNSKNETIKKSNSKSNTKQRR
jgi:hypothetical protein